MNTTDTATYPTRHVGFHCKQSFVDALREYAAYEGCSVSAAAHAIIKRELQYLDYIEVAGNDRD